METTIINTVPVGGAPAAPNATNAAPPAPAKAMPLRADLLTEYVSGGGLAWYLNYLQALPQAMDDLSRDFGDAIYDKMLLDPQIASDINTLKVELLSRGYQIHAADVAARQQPAKQAKDTAAKPTQAPPDEQSRDTNAAPVDEFPLVPRDSSQAAALLNPSTTPEQDLAEEIADFVTRVLLGMDTPFIDVLWDLLDAIATGNRVAEIVWEVQDDRVLGRPMLSVRRLVVKPREATAFVVNPYNEIAGLVAVIPGQGYSLMTGTLLVNETAPPTLLPAEKFLMASFRTKNGDPRGSPALRAVYNPWWLKQQLWAEYLKYLTQFASATLIGYTAENALPEVLVDDDGLPIGEITPEQAMTRTLIKLRNGTAAAFPNGSKVEPVKVSDNGEAFLMAFDLINREISKYLLHQVRATMEAKHGSRADSETGQDILGHLVTGLGDWLEELIVRGLIRKIVAYNYGPDLAREYTPGFTLGDTQQQDFAPDATSVATLWSSGYLDPSQIPGLDKRLGLPARSPEELQMRIHQKLHPPQVFMQANAADEDQATNNQRPPFGNAKGGGERV